MKIHNFFFFRMITSLRDPVGPEIITPNSLVRDWQNFCHGSDIPTWSDQFVCIKSHISRQNLSLHISGLQRLYGKIPKSQITSYVFLKGIITFLAINKLLTKFKSLESSFGKCLPH